MNGRKMDEIIGSTDRKGYLSIQVHGHGKYKLHRLAWFMHYGTDVPDGMTIDHINRVKTDNRIANLRLATIRDQRMNQHKPQKPTEWGYRCRHAMDGLNVSLGFFPTKELADEGSAVFREALMLGCSVEEAKRSVQMFRDEVCDAA